MLALLRNALSSAIGSGHPVSLPECWQVGVSICEIPAKESISGCFHRSHKPPFRGIELTSGCGPLAELQLSPQMQNKFGSLV